MDQRRTNYRSLSLETKIVHLRIVLVDLHTFMTIVQHREALKWRYLQRKRVIVELVVYVLELLLIGRVEGRGC